MERPTRVPRPLRLLAFFGQKPQAVGRETSPELEPELEEPKEMSITLPLGEGGELVECPLCLLPQPPEAFPTLASCDHRSCWTCLEQYLHIAVSESRVQVACPHCPAALQPADVHRLLAEPALRDKYEEFLLRRLLVADPGTRWCPAPDCSYAVIAYGCAECPRLTCGREGCGTEFCYHCRQPWHPDGPCVPVPPAPSLASPAAQLVHLEDLAHAEAEDIKVCPRCSAFIMKINDGSCNHMNCTVCGCLFCWLCLQEISDVHFLSPSGCTFSGKRPWSRTRKILWQLGMVLGAPMVTSLVAGIAVPVITIGIPIYMGRKVLGQRRRSSLSGCQQCLSVTSSVLLSLFVSPIITAVTVGVGVPLMLTYVYGVVVLSLCRSRWGCGGSRSPPGDLSVVELENLTKCESCAAVCLLACALRWAARALFLPHISVAVTSPEPGAPCGPVSVLPRWCHTHLCPCGEAAGWHPGTSLFAHPAMCLVAHSAPCSDGERSLQTGYLAPSLSPPVNELWSVLPSPRPGEDGVLDTTTFPSGSHSPRRGAAWKEHDSQSASMVALVGSMLSEGQDMSYRPCVCLQGRHQHRGGSVDRSSAASCPGAEPVQCAVRAESLWGLPGRHQ
ncbi:PREDICTED: E3 ubiquitin-protein ligase RNF19B-like isoform X2 [Haliaeetus leucocephalus]|uniref:E3 ubiquitin-protein ligase RNF19B-like isoform X2 n=1 Tax=Haliaeetus leucocephalus TaxID=52644 RepID=UPI00053CB58A|nr:PREDICTED: E3 ubiquitin-protein ligase RNF19B-like isoform X2 [Haliaeetus leucocephalus]